MQSYLSKEELALYTLIWNRFVASQMKPAVFDQTVGRHRGRRHHLPRHRADHEVRRLHPRLHRRGGRRELGRRRRRDRTLPPLSEGEILKLLELKPEQHFTQPPPRYSQATLIKELEEKGIGRPSTYASIMSTILAKEYVGEDNKRLHATELGFLVTDLLVESFPDLLNVEFTAGMEDILDEIEEGKQPWLEAMRDFYGPFSQRSREGGRAHARRQARGAADRHRVPEVRRRTWS